MLSIGKLAMGQANYHLDQAGGPVTHAGAISSGLEDYYVGGPEAAGAWIGSGCAALGLRGTVHADELHRVVQGEHPATGEPLGRVREGRVPGFDVTCSAPKSASVVFGVGDPELRAAVQTADDRAVRDALACLERHAAVIRRGAGGSRVTRTGGLVAAAFRHRTSRTGDPQLHTDRSPRPSASAALVRTTCATRSHLS